MGAVSTAALSAPVSCIGYRGRCRSIPTSICKASPINYDPYPNPMLPFDRSPVWSSSTEAPFVEELHQTSVFYTPTRANIWISIAYISSTLLTLDDASALTYGQCHVFLHHSHAPGPPKSQLDYLLLQALAWTQSPVAFSALEGVDHASRSRE